MIVITGGAGFIGSNLLWKFNQEGFTDILIVDNIQKSEKWKNLVNLKYSSYLHKDEFLSLVINNKINENIDAVFHLGACSATTETDMDYLMKNNVNYSITLAKWCQIIKARFIYASSAATYGNGSQGFDDTKDISVLRPINRYGYSKHLFDLWVKQQNLENTMVGLKFFNVFGPNEYHKGSMQSIIQKSFQNVKDNKSIQLFKSYHPKYSDGEQKRDFIYVKDTVNVMYWFFKNKTLNGLFNLGTGKAQTWNDLAKAVFLTRGKEIKDYINYIEMPLHLQHHYQYFTEAKMTKLHQIGYKVSFTSLNDSIKDYIHNYLEKNLYLS